jgi:large subunit ribosomal protein L5
MLRYQLHLNNISTFDFYQKFNYKNLMKIPKIKKIILNFGIKDISLDKKRIVPALAAIELITNQRYLLTKSRKSILVLKIRKNNIVGCKVSLSKTNLINFIDKFITLVLPKIRSFQGFSPLIFDGSGNFSYTLKDILMFNELDSEYDKFYKLNPLNITITTTAETDQEARFLLSSLQFPFISK